MCQGSSKSLVPPAVHRWWFWLWSRAVAAARWRGAGAGRQSIQVLVVQSVDDHALFDLFQADVRHWKVCSTNCCHETCRLMAKGPASEPDGRATRLESDTTRWWPQMRSLEPVEATRSKLRWHAKFQSLDLFGVTSGCFCFFGDLNLGLFGLVYGLFGISLKCVFFAGCYSFFFVVGGGFIQGWFMVYLNCPSSNWFAFEKGKPSKHWRSRTVKKLKNKKKGKKQRNMDK